MTLEQVHGHPYVSIQLDDGCFNTATAPARQLEKLADTGRLGSQAQHQQRYSANAAEIEHTHNTPEKPAEKLRGDAFSSYLMFSYLCYHSNKGPR